MSVNQLSLQGQTQSLSNLLSKAGLYKQCHVCLRVFLCLSFPFNEQELVMDIRQCLCRLCSCLEGKVLAFGYIITQGDSAQSFRGPFTKPWQLNSLRQKKWVFLSSKQESVLRQIRQTVWLESKKIRMLWRFIRDDAALAWECPTYWVLKPALNTTSWMICFDEVISPLPGGFKDCCCMATAATVATGLFHRLVLLMSVCVSRPEQCWPIRGERVWLAAPCCVSTVSVHSCEDREDSQRHSWGEAKSHI